jgi:hypothetical protein
MEHCSASRSAEPQPIHPVVLEKAPIFSGKKRVNHVLRHLVQVYDHSPVAVKHPDNRSVIREKRGNGSWLVRDQLGNRRQIVGVHEVRTETGSGYKDGDFHYHRQGQEKEDPKQRFSQHSFD